MRHEIGDKTFFVLSRREAQEFQNDTPWACISISDWDEWPEISETNRIDILRLRFADWDSAVCRDDPANEYLKKEFLFNEKQAREIQEFVDRVWDQANVFMVHCFAGISRSAGVAAAISKVKLDEDMSFFKLHRPNMLVYRKVMDVYHD